jgi:ribokinase
MGGRVVVAGSLNADLTVRTERRPEGGETVTGSDLTIGNGGKGANQAVAAARLGGAVAMLGAVGADDFGRAQLDAVRGEGIDVGAVAVLPDVATGTAVIVVDAVGENSIVISPGANGRVDATLVDSDPSWFAGAAVVCLCLEIPVDAVLAVARRGRSAGAQVVLNLSPFQEVPAELLTLTDLLLVNEHELAQVLGPDAALDDEAPDGGEPDELWVRRAGALGAKGVRRAIVTLGAEGSVVLDQLGATRPEVEPIPAIRVTAVDTTGCGDAFTGAVAAALARGRSLVDAARLASRISAVAATRAGAQSSYPSRAEAADLAGNGW